MKIKTKNLLLAFWCPSVCDLLIYLISVSVKIFNSHFSHFNHFSQCWKFYFWKFQLSFQSVWKYPLCISINLKFFNQFWSFKLLSVLFSISFKIFNPNFGQFRNIFIQLLIIIGNIKFMKLYQTDKKSTDEMGSTC